MSMSFTNIYFTPYWICKIFYGRNVRPQIFEEPNEISNIWKLIEISESSQCRPLNLPENLKVTIVSSPCPLIHEISNYVFFPHFQDLEKHIDRK